jgi:probable HAF family extracellular repeat protein
MKAIMNLLTRTLYILASFASFTATSQAFTLKYHVTAITPGFAQGVNDKGDVGGTLNIGVKDSYGYQIKHAFLYKNGKTTDFGVYNTPQDPDYESTIGQAVNNSDIVVGNISNPGGPKGGITEGAFDAFSWKNGVMTDIAQGTSNGGSSADAVGVNEQGEAVGSYDAGVFLRIGFGIPHAYVSLNGVQTDLSTLGGENGNWSYGFAINNAGQVVGVSTNTPISPYDQSGVILYYAFLWGNGTMKAIGGAQSSNFAPTAINDNGWIAGTLNVSQIAGTYSGQAVLYVNSRFIPLGTVKGFATSQSLSMNDLGMVVGNLLGGPSASSSVFVYDGVMHNLNTLVDGGWTITTVGKINIFGQIAATGTKSGSTTTYALLLTPSLF